MVSNLGRGLTPPEVVSLFRRGQTLPGARPRARACPLDRTFCHIARQDPESRSCNKLSTYGSPDAFVLVKQLCGGDLAVGFFNFGDAAAHVELHFWDLGLPLAGGFGLHFRDCLAHSDLGIQTESYSEKVAAHGCRLYRCTLEETR